MIRIGELHKVFDVFGYALSLCGCALKEMRSVMLKEWVYWGICGGFTVSAVNLAAITNITPIVCC